MKLTNERILNDSSRLSLISQKELPIKASYAIAKNLAKFEAELKTYNNEREKLIQKYAVKDKKGVAIPDENNQISIDPKLMADWTKDIKDLLAIENEIVIHQFSIELLAGQSMTPADVMLIEYMIED